MAGRLQGGGILVDSVGVMWDVLLVSSTVFTEITGQMAATPTPLTLAYYRQGEAIQTYAASDLPLITSPWEAGGWKEVNQPNAPGLYRLDLPNAAFAAGSPTPDWVTIIVKIASILVYYERIPLVTAAAAGGDATAANQAAILAAVATKAAPGDAMTLEPGERDNSAAALLDLVDALETGLTVREALRAAAAWAVGDLAQVGSDLVLTSLDGTKDRATATVNTTTGQRTVTGRDLS